MSVMMTLQGEGQGNQGLAERCVCASAPSWRAPPEIVAEACLGDDLHSGHTTAPAAFMQCTAQA